MLNVSGTTQIVVATAPVDLRSSFNRLYGLVVEHLKGDPLSGNLFCYELTRNRIGNSGLELVQDCGVCAKRWNRKVCIAGE